MAEERAPREPRNLETRENDIRDMPWEPASLLPDPDSQDGWVFRWIRTSMVGNPDNTNVSKKFREGWEPVRAEDHPELQIMSDHKSEWTRGVTITEDMPNHRCKPSITILCVRTIHGCLFLRQIVKLVWHSAAGAVRCYKTNNQRKLCLLQQHRMARGQSVR